MSLFEKLWVEPAVFIKDKRREDTPIWFIVWASDYYGQGTRAKKGEKRFGVKSADWVKYNYLVWAHVQVSIDLVAATLTAIKAGDNSLWMSASIPLYTKAALSYSVSVFRYRQRHKKLWWAFGYNSIIANMIDPLIEKGYKPIMNLGARIYNIYDNLSFQLYEKSLDLQYKSNFRSNLASVSNFVKNI